MKTKRQLATIMFTDIIGYTALMQADESKAAAQRARHRKVFEVSHEKYDGNIVQYYGDGTLSVFNSAVNACECAIQIQQQLKGGEDEVLLRIGLHMGDIVFDKTEVYGDAVNLAARIESIATGGSILLSSVLNRELNNKTSVSTVSLGTFELKNVENAIEIFAISNAGLSIPRPHELDGKTKISHKGIAVLPFVNMSADADNEYFSDGMTDDIINALSKIDSLKVTSRTSSFYFKDKALPVKKIAKELGVSVILEGSVRVSGNALRISAQLIQAEDDYHFWSETWDRKLDNIFETQDEISLLIADKLREQFGHFDIQEHLVEKQTQSVKAYEQYLKGRYYLNKWNAEDTNKAIKYFEAAIAMDAEHAESYAELAGSYSFLGTTGFLPYEEAWIKAHNYTIKAQKLERNLAEVFYQLGNEAFFIEGNHAQSLVIMNKAINSKPNYSEAHQFLSFLYIIAGDQNNARKHLDLAVSINPMSEQTRFFKGYFHYMVGKFESAIDIMQQCIDVNDKNIPAHSIMTSCLLCMEKYDEAITYYDTIPQEVVIPEERSGVNLIAYAMKGDQKNVNKYLEEVKVLGQGHNAITAEAYLFYYHAKIGAIDAAYDWIDAALKSKSYVVPMRIADPLIAKLQEDSRYHRYLKTIFQSESKSSQSKNKKPLMDDDVADQAIEKLIDHLQHNHPYLSAELSLRTLAKQIDIPANQLSWLINARLGVNFNDLINKYRIQKFISLAKNPDNASITIMGLAYDSGFNSKTTFNTSFKKVTGMTPKQYMQEITS